MTTPLVSIILVNYNNAEDTLTCIDSLENIEYNNFEIIIVENGSTDDSLQILSSRINDHTLIPIDKNNGYAAGANIGIKEALQQESEYVLLLNNDTIVETDFLAPLVNTVSNMENIVCATSVIKYIESDNIQYAGGKLSSYFPTADFYTDIKYDAPYRTDVLLGAVVFLSADFISSIDGLDENYFFGHDDLDLSYQIQKQGYTAVVVPDSVVYHHAGAVASNLNSFRTYNLTRNHLYYINKNFDSARSIFAYMYFVISRFVLLLPGVGFIEDNYYNYIYSTLLGVYDHITNHKFRRPEFF